MQRLTKEQGIILSGFTGLLCCNISDFHEDIEKRLGGSVLTHQIPDLKDKIKKLYEEDFYKLMPGKEVETIELYSDYDINQMVAARLNKKLDSSFDPCWDWDHAGEVIKYLLTEGYLVQLTKAGAIVTLPSGGRVEQMHTNQLHAIMVCFIKAWDIKNDFTVSEK